jgi:glycine/D-amino acid oxidase-like deaminating enzyme
LGHVAINDHPNDRHSGDACVAPTGCGTAGQDDSVKDYASYSFWLETSGDDLTPRPRLDGSIDVDVAVMGAGYTGLWTAYYLLRREPSLRVAVVEREIAGFGASGRNGGWCYAGFPVSVSLLRERFGTDAARAVFRAMVDTVGEIERVLSAEKIDAQWAYGGVLRLARGEHQRASIEGAHQTLDALGLADCFEMLDAAQIADRIRVTDAVAALYNPVGASIHPARLARGLARAVERRGGAIYEQTPVVDYETGDAPRLITPYGDVRAKTIVLAGEAYSQQLPKLRRTLVPMYSLIVLTEPLSESDWDQIGWRNRELVASSRMSVDYLNRTVDGRILFGGRGAPYRMHSLIDDGLDRHASTHDMLRRMAIEWFPMLRDVRFTHAWGGPLGMPRDWMPTTSYDATAGVACAGGYTGSGVATANLFGRILTDLITGAVTPLTRLPTVNHRSPRWEPEPLRWLGIRYAQEGFARLDREAERTGQAPTGRTLVERIGRH